jgi:hypothetical protein
LAQETPKHARMTLYYIPFAVETVVRAWPLSVREHVDSREAERASSRDVLTRMTIVRDLSTVICLGRHTPREATAEPPERVFLRPRSWYSFRNE